MAFELKQTSCEDGDVRTTLREILAESHISAVAIAVLLLWSIISAFRALLWPSLKVAEYLFPVGKETDRHWEQGEDPSMLDPKLQIYGRTGKLVVLDEDERNELRRIGVRTLMRATKLTQKAIYSILSGKGVRKPTMKMFRIGLASLRS